jgi:hypothetical protein
MLGVAKGLKYAQKQTGKFIDNNSKNILKKNSEEYL